jgi:hypothetical protein
MLAQPPINGGPIRRFLLFGEAGIRKTMPQLCSLSFINAHEHDKYFLMLGLMNRKDKSCFGENVISPFLDAPLRVAGPFSETSPKFSVKSGYGGTSSTGMMMA